MEKDKNIFKDWLDRFKEIKFGSVLLEDGHLSLGRSMNWIVFGMMVYMWATASTMPPYLMDAFWGLLAYNGGKKFTGPVADFFKSKKDAKAETKALPEE
jgi:hypothetical protein